MKNEKPGKQEVAQALAAAFDVPIQSADQRIEDMDFTRVQVVHYDRHPLTTVIGVDGAWTLTIEYAQDDTGDIEMYAAGAALAPNVIDAIARADTTLNGFLIGGLDMFVLNPDYADEDRELARKLKRRIERRRGGTGGTQA